MKKQLLVFPGYCIGLGGLVLITYRTFLAVASQSKTITLQVNSYGEQYLDLFILCFVWIVSIIGLWSLTQLIRMRENKTIHTEIKETMNQHSDSFYSMNNGSPSSVVSLRLPPSSSQGYQFLNEGEVSTASVSISVLQENLSEAL